MKTHTVLFIDKDTPVSGRISTVNDRRVMYLNIGDSPYGTTIILEEPEFLDKLSNEADRLCREFVEDYRATYCVDCDKPNAACECVQTEAAL